VIDSGDLGGMVCAAAVSEWLELYAADGVDVLKCVVYDFSGSFEVFVGDD